MNSSEIDQPSENTRSSPESRKTYATPTLTCYGDVGALTLQHLAGPNPDKGSDGMASF